VLKLGIPFLPRLLFSTLFIEARDSRPRPISRHLTGLRVEGRGKRVLTSEHGAIALQIIGGDATLIHPFSQTFVPDELGDLDRLINGCVLFVRTSYLVLIDQQEPLASSVLFCYTEYTPLKSIIQGAEPMNRTNVYLTEKQLERLHARAQHEGVSMAELIRRAIDVFLAWDDPAYVPTPTNPQKRNAHSSPL